MQLADVYRILEDEERILPGDEFNMFVLRDDCWGAVDKFAGHRVREVSDRGKIVFRRLVVREVIL